MRRTLPSIVALVFLLVGAVSVRAAGNVQKLGEHVYAYISDNDASSNSTFLLGANGIVVVDTGLNAVEGRKLLDAIREKSNAPIRYILNTHYHPDHQGGNETVGPNAVIISTPFTRAQTLQFMKRPPLASRSPLQLKPANLTVDSELSLYSVDDIVQIYAVGAAHTGGDAIAYFPRQGVVAMGDVYLTKSCPDIDKSGDVRHWVKVLDFILSLKASRFVPGHFEVGSRADVQQFRNYLDDLYNQVLKMYNSGATLEQVEHGIHMEKYSDFRQFPKFGATFQNNAAAVYREISNDEASR